MGDPQVWRCGQGSAAYHLDHDGRIPEPHAHDRLHGLQRHVEVFEGLRLVGRTPDVGVGGVGLLLAVAIGQVVLGEPLAHLGTTTELVENGRPLSQDELDAYARAYEESVMGANMAIITGSLPSGTPHTFYRRLVEKTRCPCVLDFRGEGLLSVLEFEPLVIKPNRQELAATLGQPVESEPSLLAGMRSLNARGARWVLVTQGASDVWLTSKTQTHRFRPPKIEKLVNPIASGDAMAAAIAWGVINGKSMPESVCIGIAAAGQNARDLLPCRLNPATLPAEAAKVVHTKI